MAGASISFHNVSKHYGPVAALEAFDLEVVAGEFMTFLGPSGSGKTTALNVLAGFTPASSGDVLIGGKSIINRPPEKRNVGMVFQNYALFPHLNVFENVAFPLKLRGVKGPELRRKVDEALGMVQLADFAGRQPKELSGGQRQRIAFARAVVFEPPVLLMDEPLGALDLKLRQSMQIEIKRYHSQLGCTIIFVTHDQGEALALSDRIAVMGNGRISQVDRAELIYDRPANRYVAEFIGRTNIFTLEDGPSGGLRIVGSGSGFAPGTQDWTAGTTLSLRPEKIQRRAAGEAEGGLDARIDEVLFQGDLVHYTALTSEGLKISFQELRSPGIELLQIGSPVTLGFRPADALRL